MQLPEKFIERTRPHLADQWEAFEAALQTEPPVSVRLNDKTTLSVGNDTVQWCAAGHYLLQRPQFTLDPLLHAGCYYVQEAASMFLQQALQQCVSPQGVVLDLCAAPGGKSTLASQFLHDGGLLVANEPVRSRAFVLAENLQKWGNGNVVVTNNMPADFAPFRHSFDAILVDAPCSGEGMFRKDAGAIAEWSEANVHNCVARQRSILSDMWEALKPEGILVYSTCTYNHEEDEQNVQWVITELGADYVPLQVDDAWQLISDGLGYHFYPHRTRGEGFFLAVLRKHADVCRPPRLKIETSKAAANTAVLNKWLVNPQAWMLAATDVSVDARPVAHAAFMAALQQKLSCLVNGLHLAEMRGHKWMPTHALAMAKTLNRNVFEVCEIDLPTALSYLRTEAIVLADAPLGMLLLTYQNVPLGWVKNVGNRCNNLYPNEWRIRKK